MHYHPSTFSVNGQDTIVALDDNIVIGMAQELSPLDILGTNLLYACPESHPPPSIILPEEPPTTTQSLTNPYPCGNVFDGQMQGTLTSQGYPTYTHNQDCGWIIRVPKGYILTLSFKPLSLEFR